VIELIRGSRDPEATGAFVGGVLRFAPLTGLLQQASAAGRG